MKDASGSLDYWRRFFRSANSDIFELIEKAILVAAVDCPKEFKGRRDQIAEKLFSSRLSRCSGCDRVELQVPDCGENERVEEEEGRSVKRELVEKDSKVESCNCDTEDLSRGGVSNYSYEEAEALTEVIEEEREIVGEVLRIKEVLCNTQEKSDGLLYESLRKLQLMQLSVEILKATEIGRAVNVLRKHNSKQIQTLSRSLIDSWKLLVDEWVKVTAAITEQSPDSVNPSVVDDEEGLPSPPMDEGALFATQTTTFQLSEFFDGMDEDGNFSTSGNINKITDARQVVPANHRQVRRQQSPQKEKPLGMVDKPIKPCAADSRPGKHLKLVSEQKPIRHFSGVQRMPSNTQEMQKPKHSGEEASDMARLENAKRKLQEGYRQAAYEKKQRTVQIMELHDLPKQPNLKPKNQGRNRANIRK